MTLHISMAALETFQRGLVLVPEQTRRELLSTMTSSTLLLEREVKDRMPRVSGISASSITSDAFSTPVGVIGTVGSSQPSVLFVELGTKPHMPPVHALIPWVRAVLGVDAKRAPSVAFLVARKIAKKGTKPQKHFESAVVATENQVVRAFEDAANRVASLILGAA